MTTRRGRSPRRAPPTNRLVLAAVESATAHEPRVSRRRMFGCPAFFIAGRMFACVVGDEVGLKLPFERVEALLAGGRYVPFRPLGKPAMRQWVAAPRQTALELARDPAIVREALRFVEGSTEGGR